MAQSQRSQNWADWLRRKLDLAGWSQSDLIAQAGPERSFSKSTVSRWLIGHNLPSSETVFEVAKIFGADPREAFEAAGYTHLTNMTGDIVAATDPAEAFVQRIRARGFPSEIEERLIVTVRAETEQRRRVLEATLDTVAEAVKLARNARA